MIQYPIMYISYHSLHFRLIMFIDSYDPPLKGLQEDLNFVSPRIGEVIYVLYSALQDIIIKIIFFFGS